MSVTFADIEAAAVRIAGHEHLAADPNPPAAEAILAALQINPH